MLTLSEGKQNNGSGIRCSSHKGSLEDANIIEIIITAHNTELFT
jgi:hypothetical protein